MDETHPHSLMGRGVRLSVYHPIELYPKSIPLG